MTIDNKNGNTEFFNENLYSNTGAQLSFKALHQIFRLLHESVT